MFFDNKLSYFAWLWVIIAPIIFTQLSLHYLKEKIVLEDNKVKLTKGTWVKGTNENKKTFSLFRTSKFASGNKYTRMILTQQFNINELEKYGLTKDFNMDPVEACPGFMQGFPSQEIVFIMNDGSISSLNAKPYTKNSIRKLKSYIANQSGLNPTGSLNDL